MVNPGGGPWLYCLDGVVKEGEFGEGFLFLFFSFGGNALSDEVV